MLLLVWMNLLAAGLPRTVISQSQAKQTTTLQIGPQTDHPSTALTLFTERTVPPPTRNATTPGPISLTPQKPPFSGDFVVKYYGDEFSTQDLLVKLNMTSAPFDLLNICPKISYSCESVCPLGGRKEDDERLSEKPCYCDKLCLELGDCCFDYFLRCAADPVLEHRELRHICVQRKSRDYRGYAMIASCPANNPDKSLESLCNGTSSSVDLPVSDLETNIVYKNAFCARCNHVNNETYWSFLAVCDGNYTERDIPKRRSLMLEFIMANCTWSFGEPPGNYGYLKRCLAVVNKECANSEHVKTEPMLANLCSFYVFPVCHSVGRKNPHCEICRGMDISSYSCDCSALQPTLAPIGVGSLLILFDFSSSSSHTVRIGRETTVVKNKACAAGFAFDPFRERCIKFYTTGHSNSTNETAGNYSCNGVGLVQIDITLANLYPNGSLWIPLYKRMFNSHSYFINGSSLFVCTNLTRNYTETTTLASEDPKVTAEQIITYIGCAVSMISLIILLCIYTIAAELRTLPGKNLMCLSITMLSYHIFFSLIGQTNRPHFCTAVAVLLHYCLLSTFCWMSVMAFDVAKTFGVRGQTNRSSRAGQRKKLLAKYSLFAWTTPAVVVAISIILDKTETVFIGYGRGRFCWISNGRALLVIFGVPVAVVLVFNCIALSMTMASIRKVQKSTQQIVDQRQQTSLPILYIKLSSALGFTWMLGFIVPFVEVEFLSYLFVIFNSLQGFFIFLAFVANKRTLNKVKGFWNSRIKARTTKTTDSATGDNKPNKTQSNKMEEQLITTAL